MTKEEEEKNKKKKSDDVKWPRIRQAPDVANLIEKYLLFHEGNPNLSQPKIVEKYRKSIDRANRNDRLF